MRNNCGFSPIAWFWTFFQCLIFEIGAKIASGHRPNSVTSSKGQMGSKVHTTYALNVWYALVHHLSNPYRTFVSYELLHLNHDKRQRYRPQSATKLRHISIITFQKKILQSSKKKPEMILLKTSQQSNFDLHFKWRLK